MPKEKRNKPKALGKKGKFVGYCDNSKSYRIYVPTQRTIEFSGDVTFDEDAALRKAKDSPPPAVVERQVVNKKEVVSEFELEPENELVDNPMGSMDPLDPPPHDLPTKKRPLWLRDTLQVVEQHATPIGMFRESMKPSRFQGYVAP